LGGRSPADEAPLVATLSELAARVQRGRTTDAVLEIAGTGILGLKMRLGAFQVEGGSMVLRYVATSKARLEAIERAIGRPLRGLRANLADWGLVRQVVQERRTVYRQDLDIFDRFLRESTSYDPTALDATPVTAGITTGVLAPLYVRDQPWGLLAVVSRALAPGDAAAVSLFAAQVASALEVAEFIEELEQTNRELARAQQELVKQERLAALGELAAVVAHEVRNPLGVLFNSVSSLRRILPVTLEGSKLTEVETLVTIVAEEADRLNHIVSDLLDLARPNLPSIETGSLIQVVEEAVAAARTDPAHACVIVHVEATPDLPPIAMDPRFLRQALVNVVLNGLQEMPDGGDLTVRAAPERREGRVWARVDVIDTGHGIPPEIAGRIFQPFFTTKPSGTGLGLAVVKRIMDAHHGEVTVESGPGGTTFTLRLPVEAHGGPLLGAPPGDPFGPRSGAP